MPDFRATIAIVLFLCSFASHAQLYTVNSGNDPVPRPANDNALNDGKCTFYEALENVNAGVDIFEDCPKDKNFIPLTPEIRFSGISKINLLNADPKQSDTPFSIIGNVVKLKIRGPIQFDGNKQTRILVFGGDTALEVEQVHFTNGTSDYEPQMIAPSGAGGCILVNNGGGKLVVKTSEFTGCVAQNGGAIGMGGITLELDNVIFKSNKAVGTAQLQTGQGGAIFGTGKTATVKNTTFESNEATNAGGAWFGASPDAVVMPRNGHARSWAQRARNLHRSAERPAEQMADSDRHALLRGDRPRGEILDDQQRRLHRPAGKQSRSLRTCALELHGGCVRIVCAA